MRFIRAHKETIALFAPAAVAVLTEVQRQVGELQQPDWRTLAALGIAQLVGLIARVMTLPE